VNCRVCGRPLTDRTSRMFHIGPECRSRLSDAQLAASLRAAKQEAAPGYIPPTRPPSAEARVNNADARAKAAAPDPDRVCHRHGGIEGACPQCRREADPNQAAARIIYDVQRERALLRDAAYERWLAARPAVQLELA